jgi:hypothetical protein
MKSDLVKGTIHDLVTNLVTLGMYPPKEGIFVNLEVSFS